MRDGLRGWKGFLEEHVNQSVASSQRVLAIAVDMPLVLVDPTRAVGVEAEAKSAGGVLLPDSAKQEINQAHVGWFCSSMSKGCGTTRRLPKDR